MTKTRSIEGRKKRRRLQNANIGSQPSKRLKGHISTQIEGLCEECATVDLDVVLSRRHCTKIGVLVRRFYLHQLPKETCSLCSLIATALLHEKHAGHNNIQYELRTYSSKETVYMAGCSVDTSSLGVNPAGPFLVPLSDEASFVRTVEPDSIDFEIPRGWLRLCRDWHTKTCGQKNSSLVPFMKLIDCENGQIVPAANHSYVTLSYQWGASRHAAIHSGWLPEDMPPTIRDSLTVTLRLGFKYLWVDRYCINQQCPEEVHAQVHKMDSIYRCSELTIIAVAGEDPMYGLPGVGRRHRRKQPCARIGKHILVSSLSDPKHMISTSTWNQRAWTYQEALLSRRRLVFTDEQVYYECYGMHCCEVIDQPLRDMHIKSGQNFKRSFCVDENIGAFPKSIGRSDWEVFRRIQEYTHKRLSQPSDILNGILGVLQAFEDHMYGVRHIQGVPILARSSKPLVRKTNELSIRYTIDGFLASIMWVSSSSNTSTRRKDFPSWSWIGWFGSVTWPNYLTGRSSLAFPNAKVTFETRDGRLIDWDAFHSSYDVTNERQILSNYMRISSWVTPLRIVPDDSAFFGCGVGMVLEDNSTLRIEHHSPTALSADRDYLGIHLSYDNLSAIVTGCIMIVSDMNGTMERVGIGRFSLPSCYLYDDDDGVCKTSGLECPDHESYAHAKNCTRSKVVKERREIRLG